MPVKKSLGKKCWPIGGIIYSGNFIGALILVGLILMSSHPFDYSGKIGLYYILTAEHKLTHTFIDAIGLGIMCNMMVCLAACISFSAPSLTDRIVAILLPTGLFIAAGFEHSIANIFMVPAGTYTLMSATLEILHQIIDAEILKISLTWPNFILKNLITVTIGNIIGGSIFIVLYQWLIHPKHND